MNAVFHPNVFYISPTTECVFLPPKILSNIKNNQYSYFLNPKATNDIIFNFNINGSNVEGQKHFYLDFSNKSIASFMSLLQENACFIFPMNPVKLQLSGCLSTKLLTIEPFRNNSLPLFPLKNLEIKCDSLSLKFNSFGHSFKNLQQLTLWNIGNFHKHCFSSLLTCNINIKNIIKQNIKINPQIAPSVSVNIPDSKTIDFEIPFFNIKIHPCEFLRGYAWQQMLNDCLLSPTYKTKPSQLLVLNNVFKFSSSCLENCFDMRHLFLKFYNFASKSNDENFTYKNELKIILDLFLSCINESLTTGVRDYNKLKSFKKYFQLIKNFQSIPRGQRILAANKSLKKEG